MAVILDFCPTQIAKDKRIARETAKKLGQVIIFPGVRIERHHATQAVLGASPKLDKSAKD